jgi:hypothetical protein
MPGGVTRCNRRRIEWLTALTTEGVAASTRPGIGGAKAGAHVLH